MAQRLSVRTLQPFVGSFFWPDIWPDIWPHVRPLIWPLM